MTAVRVPLTLESVVLRLRTGAQNAISRLPGERPKWVVLEWAGPMPLRPRRPRVLGVPVPPQLVGGAQSVEEVARTLSALGRAEWLEGVIVRIEGPAMDPAAAFTLREAFAALRRSGKKTVAYLPRVDLASYYLASAAQEIVCPESADFFLHGFGIAVTYFRDALARFGLRFEKVAVGAYKSAFDTLTRQTMTDADREQLTAVLDGLSSHYIGEIASARGVPVTDVFAAIDAGVTSASQAHAAKLVDRVAYEDEVIPKGAQPIAHARRFLRLPIPRSGAKRIALVSLVGPIVAGRSRSAPVPMPPFGGGVAGADSIVEALRAAASDPSTAAIVLHVDSGGGSALASDLIWREVKRIREKKPVVGVMGAVAASGGYYVLAHASHLIAAPTTITGSIGVLTAKLVAEDLMDRLGMHTERIQKNKFAFLFRADRAWDEDSKALLRRHNGEVYERFIARVAEGRRKTKDEISALAGGRIYAGADALKVGLIDELGDIDAAIRRARELGGADTDAPVWTASPRGDMLLPNAEDPTTLTRLYGDLVRETSLCWTPWAFRPTF